MSAYTFDLSQTAVNNCIGCWSCWWKTPGKCTYSDLAKQLKYNYLGTVSKGEAAGIYMYPKIFRKVLKLISDLGLAYEETHAFNEDIIKKLGKPYELSKFTLRLLRNRIYYAVTCGVKLDRVDPGVFIEILKDMKRKP